MKFFVVSLILATLCVMMTESQESCGPHAQFFDCEPCYEVPCGTTPPDVCPAVCNQKPGCYCEKGYRRKNEKCVLPHEC
ncbi:hypothetical protein JTB14_005459 [Gonioctena quinquepunctata]|nr:hypothetical protein JTB14_005459 [Gonioctena quinquepunctata]